MAADIYQFRIISSADANTTVQVCTGPCVLVQVVIGVTSAQQLTFKDAPTNGANNTVGVIKASITEQTQFYNAACPNGLQVVVPAGYTGNATVIFDPQ